MKKKEERILRVAGERSLPNAIRKCYLVHTIISILLSNGCHNSYRVGVEELTLVFCLAVAEISVVLVEGNSAWIISDENPLPRLSLVDPKPFSAIA